jgi:HSP20 family protein
MRLQQEVNRLVDLLLDQQPVESGWVPAVDLIERENGFEVQIDVPGVISTQLAVELCDQALVVRGTKGRSAGEPSARRFHRLERFMGAFDVEVALPKPVDPRAAEAHLEQGVLYVLLPTLTDKRHRTFRIPISEEPA